MTTRKRAPARSKTTKKPLAQKARALRGASSESLRGPYWTIESGKSMRHVKHDRKPASMEQNRRYRAGRQSVDHFHPEQYARSELEAIARGHGGEAWTFVMHRNDVPETARKMAREELERRERR